MARIRTIKPEFFTSEDVVALSPLARLLYIAIWCEADKEGRLAWKPKTFKIRYFPADDCDIDALCDEIVTRSLCVKYGDSLAYIPKFKDHQHINPREKESIIPPPNLHRKTDACFTRDDASVTVDTRSGRKEGREGKEIVESSSIPRFDFLKALIGKDVDKSIATDYIAVRKAKKCVQTETAFKLFVSESEKAGISIADAVSMCCKRGWGGFEADWIKPDDRTKKAAYVTPEWMRGAL